MYVHTHTHVVNHQHILLTPIPMQYYLAHSGFFPSHICNSSFKNWIAIILGIFVQSSIFVQSVFMKSRSWLRQATALLSTPLCGSLIPRGLELNYYGRNALLCCENRNMMDCIYLIFVVQQHGSAKEADSRNSDLSVSFFTDIFCDKLYL